MIGIRIEKGSRRTAGSVGNAAFIGLKLSVGVWTSCHTFFCRLVRVIHHWESRTCRNALVSGIICILLIRREGTIRLAASVVLRVTIVVTCHTDEIAHALIWIAAVNADLSWTYIYANSRKIPFETWLNTGWIAPWQTSSGCILSPWTCCRSCRCRTHFNAHCWDIFCIIKASIYSGAFKRSLYAGSLDVFTPCSECTLLYAVPAWYYNVLSVRTNRACLDAAQCFVISKSWLTWRAFYHAFFCWVICKLKSTIRKTWAYVDAYSNPSRKVSIAVSWTLTYTRKSEVISVHL